MSNQHVSTIQCTSIDGLLIIQRVSNEHLAKTYPTDPRLIKENPADHPTSLAVYEADSATILLVFYQHEADYATILPHFLQYEADSAANLPFILLYEADRAAIVLPILEYDADSAAILPLSCHMNFPLSSMRSMKIDGKSQQPHE